MKIRAEISLYFFRLFGLKTKGLCNQFDDVLDNHVNFECVSAVHQVSLTERAAAGKDICIGCNCILNP